MFFFRGKLRKCSNGLFGSFSMMIFFIKIFNFGNVPNKSVFFALCEASRLGFQESFSTYVQNDSKNNLFLNFLKKIVIFEPA
jgi:hypothetical protein